MLPKSRHPAGSSTATHHETRHFVGAAVKRFVLA
jgi:hypothetical protein